MPSKTVSNTSWHYLPAEIRNLILGFLLQDDCSLAGPATVSRDWRSIIEPHNFDRIKLTPSRFADFKTIGYRHRTHIHYIWFCLELPGYDCTGCARTDFVERLSRAEALQVTAALQCLFSSPSIWEPNGTLTLDISFHSPSDSEHWFKYLTFGPDIPPGGRGWDTYRKQALPAKITDRSHGWIDGRRDSVPRLPAIVKVFDQIMDERLFDNAQQEAQWWQQLPLVPAITSVTLRQQNRRRWGPTALERMLARLPRLEEFHYEPWREWIDGLERWIDIGESRSVPRCPLWMCGS